MIQSNSYQICICVPLQYTPILNPTIATVGSPQVMYDLFKCVSYQWIAICQLTYQPLSLSYQCCVMETIWPTEKWYSSRNVDITLTAAHTFAGIAKDQYLQYFMFAMKLMFCAEHNQILLLETLNQSCCVHICHIIFQCHNHSSVMMTILWVEY